MKIYYFFLFFEINTHNNDYRKKYYKPNTIPLQYFYKNTLLMESESSTTCPDFFDEMQNIAPNNTRLNFNTAHYNYQINFHSQEKMHQAKQFTINEVMAAIKQLQNKLGGEMKQLNKRLDSLEKRVGDLELKNVNTQLLNSYPNVIESPENFIYDYRPPTVQPPHRGDNRENINQDANQNIQEEQEEQEEQEVQVNQKRQQRHNMVLRTKQKKINYKGLQVERKDKTQDNDFVFDKAYRYRVKERKN